MKTFAYQSPYLLPPKPAAPNRRVVAGVWRRSLRHRGLSRPAAIALGVWILVVSVGGWNFEHGALRLPKTGGSATAVAASAPATTSVTQLAGGPSGQLLPPGTLAAYGTFANGYSRGQCTWYVASRRKVPGNWGNARTWYPRAAGAGWSVGSAPAVGAIAWTSAGYYGHVAVVEAISGGQVEVAEMNYYGPYKIDHRWTSASDWRYIY